MCQEENFLTYKKMDGEHLYMDNLSTSKVQSAGKIILKMAFRKFSPLTTYFMLLTLEKT